MQEIFDFVCCLFSCACTKVDLTCGLHVVLFGMREASVGGIERHDELEDFRTRKILPFSMHVPRLLCFFVCS